MDLTSKCSLSTWALYAVHSYKCINVIIALLRGYFSSGAVNSLKLWFQNWKQYFMSVVLNWGWPCLSEDIWPESGGIFDSQDLERGSEEYKIAIGIYWVEDRDERDILQCMRRASTTKELSNPMCQLCWSWETPLYINVHLEPIEPFYFKVRTGHFLNSISFCYSFHNSITLLLPIKLDAEENLPP